MATVIEATLVISPPTDEILNLIHTAAIDILDDVNAATDMPLTALAPRASCQEVEREFLNIHRRLIRHGYNSAVNRILDPTQIDPDGWDPQTFVMFEGSFGIPPRTLAVIIPIYKEREPLIEFLFEGQVVTVDWILGAMIYMRGNSSLASDGCGKTAFIVFLFKTKIS